MMVRIPASGELRTTLVGRSQALHDAYRAEGVEQGPEQERQLPVCLVGRKVGTDVAEPEVRLLAGNCDRDRLQDVGEWIVDAGVGNKPLSRPEGAALAGPFAWCRLVAGAALIG